MHPLLPLLPAHTCPHVQRSERSAPLFHSPSLSSFLPPRCASKSLRGFCICCVVSFHERLLCFSLPPSLSLCLCACTHTHRHTQRKKDKGREKLTQGRHSPHAFPHANDAQCEAGLKHSCQASPTELKHPSPPREREALKPSRQALILCPEDILSMTLMTVQLLRSSTVVSRCIF